MYLIAVAVDGSFGRSTQRAHKFSTSTAAEPFALSRMPEAEQSASKNFASSKVAPLANY